jgi:creatinine amidohydrolase
MKETLSYSELTWQDMKQAVDEQRIVILPVGSTEQHGPHLPLCTDDLMAQRWAIDAAEAARERSGVKTLVMPGIHYGNAQHHMAFPGTITLSFETLKNITFEVGDSVLVHGFRKLVILNVHGGNRYAVRAAAVDLAMKYARRTKPVYIRVAEDCDSDLNPLVLDTEVLKKYTEEAAQRTMVHSGSLETAKILYLLPERVFMERAEEIDIPFKNAPQEIFPYDVLTSYGARGKPREATAEAGKAMWEALVRHFADYLVQLSGKE